MWHEVVVSGVGVVSAAGCGSADFFDGLLSARARFAVMTRPGRQCGSSFIGAQIDAPLEFAGAPALLQRQTLSARAAAAAASQAIVQARLDESALAQTALYLGGGNLQQRELLLMQEKHCAYPEYISPKYGLSFQDTDIAAFCAQTFGIRAGMLALHAASASGLVALVEAAQAIALGRYRRCLVIGGLQDISHWEAQALTNMGAMAVLAPEQQPMSLYRPFDCARRGFVYGEGCAALVLERADACAGGVEPLARLAGWAVLTDGSRSPAASQAAEVAVIERALAMAGLQAAQIDYVNPHGSGSLQGDEVELSALRQAGLNNAYLNSTKSITGHTLTACAAVETVATLLQMRASLLHPSRNLSAPLSPDFNWVGQLPVQARIDHALKLSYGFGGINAALCLASA